MVDALSSTELLEPCVDEGRPSIPGVLDPLAAMERSRFWSTATRWIAVIGPAKPGLTSALDPVVLALRDHDVRMRVVLLSVAVQARVDRQAVGESLLRRHLVREVADEGDLIVRTETSRQCEI